MVDGFASCCRLLVHMPGLLATLPTQLCSALPYCTPCRLGMASMDWLGVLTRLRSLHMDFDRDFLIAEATFPPGVCALLPCCPSIPRFQRPPVPTALR